VSRAEDRKRGVRRFRRLLGRDPEEFAHDFIMKPQSVHARAELAGMLYPEEMVAHRRLKGEDESGRSRRRLTDYERDAIEKHKEGEE
tara:strand:- start:37424 stop:37684 length:261 start_codon:yes stop_codon:yes gene_type:complete